MESTTKRQKERKIEKIRKLKDPSSRSKILIQKFKG